MSVDKAIDDYLQKLSSKVKTLRSIKAKNKSLSKPSTVKTKTIKHKTVTRICVHCKKEFETFLKEKVYCTPDCRNNKWRSLYRERYAIAFDKLGSVSSKVE